MFALVHQGCKGGIVAPDDSVLVEGQVAVGGLIVEILIFVTRLLQLLLGLLQLLVLHFELNLVDRKFMQRAFHVAHHG